MKKIKLLSISNSFGVNLQHFAHQIAEANDLDLDIYVLYIGGCSIGTHAKNIKTLEPKYELYHNGESTNKMISILDGLKLASKWDYILTQQCSQKCGVIESYYPYLDELYKFVNENSKYEHFGFQETWPYSKDMVLVEMLENYGGSIDRMYRMIHDTILELSKRFNNCFVANSGDIIRNAIDEFPERLYDEQGFHMCDYGCYLIGANLVKLLLGKPLKKPYLNKKLFSEDFCNRAIEFVNKEKAFN